MTIVSSNTETKPKGIFKRKLKKHLEQINGIYFGLFKFRVKLSQPNTTDSIAHGSTSAKKKDQSGDNYERVSVLRLKDVIEPTEDGTYMVT